MDLKAYIRDIPDFPRQGILFRDITPLLADAAALDYAVRELAGPFENRGIELVAAVEARGFIFAPAVARQLKAGFVPIRKAGKLPAETTSISYDLEYGSDRMEVHTDAVMGKRVLLLDDLLATGGTMEAACSLLESLRVDICGLTFLVELTALGGRERLKKYTVHSVIKY